jgi:excisionase family DNA binding protein
MPFKERIMHEYFLRNLSELAEKRAIGMRQEAQLWDILSRDLKREAGRKEETPVRRRGFTRLPPKPLEETTGQEDRKLFVRISQAAKMMGIGRTSLYNEISSDRIRIKKSGRKTLIALSDIQVWFDRLPEGLGNSAGT